MISVSGRSAIVSSLEIEFSDSSSRHATIFGNGWNQVPVRVSFHVDDDKGPVEGLDITVLSQKIKFHHKNYDAAITDIGPADTLEELNCTTKNLGYNHAKYGNMLLKSHNLQATSSPGSYSLIYYFSSAEKNANYSIYCGIKEDDGNEVQSDKSRCLDISTLSPIHWCQPEMWSVEEHVAESSFGLEDHNALHPLDSVTLKPVQDDGKFKHDYLLLTAKVFRLNYKGNQALPLINLKEKELAVSTEYYDLGDNTGIISMSSKSIKESNYQRTFLQLWSLIKNQNFPQITGKVNFIIGVDSSGVNRGGKGKSM